MRARPLSGNATMRPMRISLGERRSVEWDEGDGGKQDERGRDASCRKPEDDRPFHVIRHVMAPAAGRLCDGGIQEVRTDRDLRCHAEARDQERRHQRPAADACQPNEKAHAEASTDQRQEPCRPAKIDHWT